MIGSLSEFSEAANAFAALRLVSGLDAGLLDGAASALLLFARGFLAAVLFAGAAGAGCVAAFAVVVAFARVVLVVVVGGTAGVLVRLDDLVAGFSDMLTEEMVV